MANSRLGEKSDICDGSHQIYLLTVVKRKNMYVAKSRIKNSCGEKFFPVFFSPSRPKAVTETYAYPTLFRQKQNKFS